ncbi:MAG: hypothetical protein JXA42_18475 [Anaerolineales bacterium]|nr:hypothetical protein [Anaerolineales bacterium]
MGNNLDRNQIDVINRKVYARYPVVDGVRPQVKKQGTRSGDRFLLVYKGRVRMDDGASMDAIVRVTADADGKILKSTTSR